MGITERREREKERRRNEILDAAEKVFFSEGLDNATMDDVAAEAELSKGTLYIYFKSKRELYLGINARGLNILREILEKVNEVPDSGLEKLKKMSFAYRDFANQYPDYFNALLYFQKIESENGLEKELAVKVRRMGEQVLQIIENVIRQGLQDDSIKCKTEPLKLSYLLWGQTTGVIQMISRLKNDSLQTLTFEPEILFQDFINMLHSGLTHCKNA